MSRKMILTELSIIPVGVSGDADDAGDVESERQGDAVSGVMYECAGFDMIVDGGVDFGGDA